MISKTNFNNGSKENILSLEDIKYMLSIVDSDLREEEKAIKLYSFCNFVTIFRSSEHYKLFSSEEVELLKKLKKVYEQYDRKGYFLPNKNTYKCTLEEMENRILKLKEAYDIINSNESDYNKAEKLHSLYPSAEQFRRTYSLFIKFGTKDNKLDHSRELLNNFDVIYNKYLEYENNGIINNVKYVQSVKKYLEFYDYAKFVINHYVNSSSYNLNEFLLELGINKDIFKFCIDTIEELDVDLYQKYLVKRVRNKEVNYLHDMSTIRNLAIGISTGTLIDGTPFDLLEFIKRVPFKNSKNFSNEIFEFMKKNTPNYCNLIMDYIFNNKLHLPSTFNPLDLKSIYQITSIIDGVLITNDDKNIIIDYLRQNNIPIISKTFVLARKKFLDGEFDIEAVKCFRKMNENKPLLIPSSNR